MTIQQIRTVKCGSKDISYTLTRKKVKNINLRIKPDGEICVSAANNVSADYIDSFVTSKLGFILDYLNKKIENKKENTDDKDGLFSNGDKLFYLGNEYLLNVVHDNNDEVITAGNKLVVKTYDTENLSYVNKLIRNWYYNRTNELFRKYNDIVNNEFSSSYKVPHAVVHVKKMKSRWGSCHIRNGIISMNSRLIYYPEMSIKYVFVHEYAHFIVPDHSRKFYEVISSVMPDYKKWSNMLK